MCISSHSSNREHFRQKLPAVKDGGSHFSNYCLSIIFCNSNVVVILFLFFKEVVNSISQGADGNGFACHTLPACCKLTHEAPKFSVADFFRCMLRLSRKPAYIFTLLGRSFCYLAISGMVTFSAKYYESQFTITAARANIAIGWFPPCHL